MDPAVVGKRTAAQTGHCREERAATWPRLCVGGGRNPAAAIRLAVLAEMARAETDTFRERIKSGLDEARRKGVTLGRRKGTGKAPAAFLAKHKDVVKLLRDGQSIRHAAAITGKGVSTVQRAKAAL